MSATTGQSAAALRPQEAPRVGFDFLKGGGEMGARMRAFDWTNTPLGAPESWPQSLKTIVRVMLDSRYAMWMLWGPELTFFCNDAYLPTLGIKRDWVLGARSDKVWEEIWPDIGPRIAQVLEHGRATWDEALLLFLERSGFPEETYHTFSYSPVYDDESQHRRHALRRHRSHREGRGRASAANPEGPRLARSGRQQPSRRPAASACEVLGEFPLQLAVRRDLPLRSWLEDSPSHCEHTGGRPEHILPPQLA